MTFAEACTALLTGKKVTRAFWNEGSEGKQWDAYIFVHAGMLYISMKRAADRPVTFTTKDLEATDWEIHP